MSQPQDSQDSGGFGFMGGGPGDGITGYSSALAGSNNAYGASNLTSNNNIAANSSIQSNVTEPDFQNQQKQQMQLHSQPQPQPQPQAQPQQLEHEAGSITRFAPPVMGQAPGGGLYYEGQMQSGIQHAAMQPGVTGMQQQGVAPINYGQVGMQHTGMQQQNLRAGMQQFQNPGMPQAAVMNPGIQQMGVQNSAMQQNAMQNSGMMQNSSIMQTSRIPQNVMQHTQSATQNSGLQQLQNPGMQQNAMQQSSMQRIQTGTPSSTDPQSAGGSQYRPQTAPQTAAPGSFAERSARAYASSGASFPQSTLQQPTAQATGSFAERSARAYASSGASVPQSTPGISNTQTAQASQFPQQTTFSQPVSQLQPTSLPSTAPSNMPTSMTPNVNKGGESPAVIALQNRLLTDATRKVQEHAYYMRQAMDKNDLPAVLDRASLMVGELGEHHSHGSALHGAGHHHSNSDSNKLNPKNYYELYMRALEDMPNFEEYLLNLARNSAEQSQTSRYTMRELYDCVHYCPHVLSRLYLQISAGSALIRSGEVGVKYVLNDLIEAVRCVQNPLRGLFLRHFLLQALRDKLPDEPQINAPLETSGVEQHPHQERGTVIDSYEFVLVNFIEMNKLWVRIQHLPGDGKSKEQRRRRERERNELRILVGTNLVRLSQLEGITSKIYGEVILPKVLDHIAACGDPLAQAYLMDCIVQVFPDEYHIETLPILLRVCPKLRDKVNIRTILQSLMDRLANYLADEELLDETDSNQVKKSLARDSFPMFEECVQNVYNARGPKLTSKEVIRLQTALLSFSNRCYQGDMQQISRCLAVCVAAIRQASATYDMPEGTVASMPTDKVFLKPLDEVSVTELEKLLSVPLNTLALKVLQLDCYGDLIGFLPWSNRRELALKLLSAVEKVGSPPQTVKEINELFTVIKPVLCDEQVAAQQQGDAQVTMELGANTSNNFGGDSLHCPPKDIRGDCASVSKLVQLLDHEDTDVVYEMLSVAKQHINSGGIYRNGQMLVAVVFAALRLSRRVFDAENPSETKPSEKEDGLSLREKSDTKEAVNSASEETSKDTSPDNVGEGEEDGAGNEANNDGESPASENASAKSSSSADCGKSEDKSVADADDENKEESPDGGDENKDESPDAVEKVEGEGLSEKKQSEESSSAPRVLKSISCRKVFIFIQQTIAMLAVSNAEIGVKLYLESALTADNFVVGVDKDADSSQDVYGTIAYELIAQAFSLYEQSISDSKTQHQCVTAMIGTLLGCRALSQEEYESLVTKTAQYAAKLLKKPDQCHLVASCAHLFYPVGQGDNITYRNPQRALECLQRALKLADACTSMNPSQVGLFVDLFDHYVYFFEKKNPLITNTYITGLVSLIKEHFSNLSSLGGSSESLAISDAKTQFDEIIRYIKRKREEPATSDVFSSIDIAQL